MVNQILASLMHLGTGIYLSHVETTGITLYHRKYYDSKWGKMNRNGKKNITENQEISNKVQFMCICANNVE